MKHPQNYTFGNAHHWCGFTWSDGNRKQDKMLNYSHQPKHSCPDDAPCRKENGGSCYFQATEDYRPTVAVSAERNWQNYNEDHDEFWRSAEKAKDYAIKNGCGIRMFDGGDIPDYEFLCRQVEWAMSMPHRVHQMTKKYDLVNRYIAEHGGDKDCILAYIDLRFSKWDGYPMPNPYGMPVFERVMTEEETTCIEQRMKMVGKEWSCADCFFRGLGCYQHDHRNIYCIDHAVEAKIVRNRGLWKKVK